MAKLGDKLNFNSLKSSAMESKEVSQAIPPRSGVTFSPGQVIEFECPGNRPNEFLDLVNNCKIKLPVTIATAEATLDRAGAYGLINKFEIVQNGVVLCSVPRYNVLLTGMCDLQMESSYKATTGRLMEGLEGDCLRGAIVPIGSRTFYLSPLCTDIAMTTPHRSLFLGSSAPLIFRLTLETNATALYSSGANATYTISNPELLIKSTYLFKESMDELSRAVKGQYKMLCNSYDHMSSTVTAGTTNSHIKLSFAKASLERIMFFIRPSAHTTAGAKFSLGSRCTASVQSYQLDIAGQLHPQVPIKYDAEGVDYMYHLLSADNIASNYGHGLSLMNAYTVGVSTSEAGTGSIGSHPEISKANPYMRAGLAADGDNYGKGPNASAAASSDIGTFIGAINLESSLVTSQNSPLYSGVNTKNGTDLYIDFVFTSVPVDCTIDFYSLSTELIYLDPDSNMWVKRN